MIAQVEGERLDNLSEAEVIARILGAHGSKVSLTIRVHEGQVDSKVDCEPRCFKVLCRTKVGAALLCTLPPVTCTGEAF